MKKTQVKLCRAFRTGALAIILGMLCKANAQSCTTPYSIPYSEGFESAVGSNGLPGCLTTNYVVGSAVVVSNYINAYRKPAEGNKFLYFRNRCTSGCAGGGNVFTPSLALVSGVTYLFRVYYLIDVPENSVNDWSVLRARLHGPGVSGLEIATVSYPANREYACLSGTFSVPATGAYKIEISATEYSGMNVSYMAIDDISVRQLNTTCPYPVNPVVIEAGYTSATLGWTEKGSATKWEAEYGPANFRENTGTKISTTTPSVTLNGLSSGTGYSFFVRAQCGTGNTSNSSVRKFFQTNCAAPTLPFTESFEGVQYNEWPLCWRVSDSNFVKTSNQSEPGRRSSAGSMYAYFRSKGNNIADTIYTRGFQLNAGTTYRLDAKYLTDGSVWSFLRAHYSSSQNPSGFVGNIAAVTNPSNEYSHAQLNGSFTPATTGVYYFGLTAAHVDVARILSLDEISLSVTAVCTTPPHSLTASGISSNSASLNWNTGSEANSWEIEYGPSGFAPGTGTKKTVTSKPYSLTGLAAAATYDYYVRAKCDAVNFSPWSQRGTFNTLLANDEAAGAIAITVDATCTGNVYTNQAATHSMNEPFASCSGNGGHRSVWFKFVAPASGAVKISNDFLGGGLGDSRLALFSASDPASYNTFIPIACDDNNGVVVANRSILYAVGLVPGTTYYVQVDGYDAAAVAGSFCLSVSSLNEAAMLPSTASCEGGQVVAVNNSYTGWLSLTDAQGRLIAMVRNTNAQQGTSAYTVSLTALSGQTPLRKHNNTPYLHRNYFISNLGLNGNTEIRLFFKDVEWSMLTNSLNSLHVTRQSGNLCQDNFNPASGTNTYLMQSANGRAGNAAWIAVVTPGFSNFFLHNGTSVLPIVLKDFQARRHNGVHELTWETSMETGSEPFMIERSSDGRQFSVIGIRMSTGQPSLYKFIDANPGAGTSFYRIKYNAPGGGETYSRIIMLKRETDITKPAISIYPNPTKGLVYFQFHNPVASGSYLLIKNAAGKIVLRRFVKDTHNELNLESFATGIYVVYFYDGVRQHVVKVMKL